MMWNHQNYLIDSVKSELKLKRIKVKEINKTVNEVSPNLSDLATFEFTCEACGHKEEVTFDMNPVNFSSAG